MPSRVVVASIVAKPDIIASFSSHICRRFLFVDDPGISAGEETMLQEKRWASFLLIPDVKNLKMVAIWSGNHKLLKMKPKLINQL
jgi:hypothetical protein